MTSIQDAFELIDRPELVWGLVAPIGTPLQEVIKAISDIAPQYKYSVDIIKISDLFNAFDEKFREDRSPEDYYKRTMYLMDQGNKLRDENKIIGGGTLAAAAAAAIHQQRSSTDPKKIERKIFIIHQLKHPEEVILLRSIYGDSFKLIGVSCSDYTKKTLSY